MGSAIRHSLRPGHVHERTGPRSVSAQVKTIVEVEDEIRGNYLTISTPMKLSDSEPEVTRAPLLGEHTDEVLKELGYSVADIAKFRENKAI